MKIRRKIFFPILACALLVLSSGCEGIFDELAENKLTVLIKGTYESNDPRAWNFAEISLDDSVNNKLDALSQPTTFWLDIAKMEAVSGSNKAQFANYRRYFEFPMTDSQNFFNGNGVVFRNDDLAQDQTWDHVAVYLRKMVIDQSAHYSGNTDGSWTADSAVSTVWGEKEIAGYDFAQNFFLSHYDTFRKSLTNVNHVFPLNIPIVGNLQIDSYEEETVLEIRFVVKNFVEQYERDFTASSKKQIYQFYALKDFLRDVKTDETWMGGNILAVARCYVPSKVVTINATNVAFDQTYIVALPDGEDKTKYEFAASSYIRPGWPGKDGVDKMAEPRLVAGDQIEAILQYRLERFHYENEDYKLESAVADGSFASKWSDYETKINQFCLPPLATAVTGTSFTLENVPNDQKYKVYKTDSIGGTLTEVGTIDQGNFIIN